MNELTETSKTPGWFMAMLVAGMLVFGFYASTHMVAAGDTWVAMACGRHFAQHGVDTVEPFSFNSHKAGPSDETLDKLGFPDWTHHFIRKIHPTGWINQNWLTHLGYYKLATWFDGDGDYAWNALVCWKFALYFMTVLLVYAAGRVLGVPPLLAAAGATLAMVVGRTFYDIRPAGYSNMLTPAFILILALTMCRNYRWIWLIVPVIVFWANVHGGYIYAFIMLAPFIGINLLLRVERRWTLCLGFVGLWLLLYLMSYKFISGYSSLIEQFYQQIQTAYGLSDAELARNIENTRQTIFGYDPETVSLLANKMLVVWGILAIISVVLTVIKTTTAGVFYFYHFLAGGVFAISLLPRFLVGTAPNLPAYLPSYATSALLSFLFVCVMGGLLIPAMAFKKETFDFLPVNGLAHTIGASAAAFVAMIVFNPFHLTNLTHTFEISVSKHAESWRQVNEWKPAFDWMDKTTKVPNPVGEEEWFGVLCILTLAVFAVWLIVCFLKPRLNPKAAKVMRAEPQTNEMLGWPKVNLALIVISFLTIYMAIRSRRFIAIAGAAAAPIVAMLVVQAWQMIWTRIRFKPQGSVESTDFFGVLASGWKWFSDKPDGDGRAIAKAIQTIIYGLVSLVILAVAVFWGLKYKRIYLDPWPTDAKYNSVFMRMTASHLKPIDACEFIRLNKLSGRVFNYWTEGGAVALGEDPDPKTGEIPLKLFMDGRAQAAYNHDKFKLWQEIFAGGPIAQEAKMRGQKFNKDLYEQIAAWIDAELKEHHVWVVLMPSSQEDSVFMQSLRTTTAWKTAYIDDVQHLLINTETPAGAALVERILAGEALYPGEYEKAASTFNLIIEKQMTERYAELYPLAKTAFDLNPSPLAALMLFRVQSFPNAAVGEDITGYVNDFIENKDAYRDEAGYLTRLNTAGICAQFLSRQDKTQQARFETLFKEFRQEAKQIERRQIW